MELYATAVVVLLASVGYPQTPAIYTDTVVPDFRVEVFGYIEDDFHRRVERYVELRRSLEEGLPPLTVTDDPAAIGRAEAALARKIRVARGPVQGQIFTPAISAELKRTLMLVVNANTLATIMDENPGEFPYRINGTYPKSQPLATMPATVLAVLPILPGDIQYRFLGRHLILHDTRANVILDRISCALECSDLGN